MRSLVERALSTNQAVLLGSAEIEGTARPRTRPTDVKGARRPYIGYQALLTHPSTTSFGGGEESQYWCVNLRLEFDAKHIDFV